MLKYLRQPYVVPEAGASAFWTAVGAGLFVGGFLAVFQPFGAYEWVYAYKIHFLLGFGGVTTLILLVNSFVIPRIAPHWFLEKNWTVGSAILNGLWNLLSIGIGNYVYTGLWFYQESSFHVSQLVFMIFATVLVGIFPATGITLFGYFRKLKKYQHPPQPDRLSAAEIEHDAELTITLVAENEKDRVTVSALALLYIESADNYSEIVFLKEGNIQQELIRSSLSRLETQLPQDFIVRCHRSYIVNLHKVQSVSGNAQGYKFHLAETPLAIPVARKYADIVTRHFKK
ncbi:MAG: LytTR family DNA-binding domain-containing protein [Spirosomataceae bacterium]